MEKRFVFLVILYCLVVDSMAQLRYPVVGRYKDSAAQGMAIWGDYAYIMNHGGRCRVYNLRKSKVERDFLLASADSNNHVNNACFGKEVIKGNNKPVIYISECHGRFRCFVENLNASGSQLVQTIELRKSNGKPKGVLDWIVDVQEGFVYTIWRDASDLKEKGIARNTISKYRLPRLSEGNKVVINIKDSLESFDAIFPNVIQGAKIRNGFMYIATGYQETASARKDAKRAVQVIDLRKKQLFKTIPLTYITMNEPEDIDFYKGKCLLFCGQNGGIYEVPIEE